jgi:hypothetical protein
MLSKCANPACSAKLLYLGNGKIFRVEREASARYAAQRKPADHTERQFEVVAGQDAAGRPEYFWLCAECAQQMTLALRDQSLVILPLGLKANVKPEAKASAAHAAAS